MNTPTTLLDDLAAAGVTLEAHGDKLRFCPRDAVTPELLEQIRTHKAELLARLQDTVFCPWCRSRDLADHPKGILCQSCHRIAWTVTYTSGWMTIERADQSRKVYR